MRYLLTGATGHIGSRVADRLISRGLKPRLFVRDPDKARARFGNGIDIAVGDLADQAALAAALRGIERVFLLNAGSELAARDALAASVARTSGVKHLVKLSTLDVEQGVGTGAWHALGEAAIRSSGVGFTFVRPTGFMSNALAWVSAVKSEGIVRSATGAGRISSIHPSDIADVAVVALTTQSYDGQALPITGPEALSYAQMLGKISAVIGRPLEFEPISEEEERRRWSARGEDPVSIDYHMSIFRAIRAGRLATVTATVERVLGRPALTFDQWAAENADEFRR
jgi:(4-alkanoyl-5-oxo-2,5-dihydrofuran-3-yl)methyl phosphate reductase